jgi:hypothetical protein
MRFIIRRESGLSRKRGHPQSGQVRKRSARKRFRGFVRTRRRSKLFVGAPGETPDAEDPSQWAF